MDTPDLNDLLQWIKAQAKELGFSDLRVTDLDVSQALPDFQKWLEKGHHGDMNYMRDNAHLRADPKKILQQAACLISVRMDYLPKSHFESKEDWRQKEWGHLHDPQKAVVSVYARGRDYHKVLRQRLQSLAKLIDERIASLNYRVAVDSAPILEVEFAKKSGIGWRGKHTLALHRQGGSMFFLGEILVDIPLPLDEPISDHCGECHACIDVCPTQAITGPYQLDARKCISYLTIEHAGPIPMEMRPLIGNRIYGCDDCQLICPWNKFAQPSMVGDFDERYALGKSSLFELFTWSEKDFDERMRGSAIFRIGYAQWVRNIVIGIGNLLGHPETTPEMKSEGSLALQKKMGQISHLVDEHIEWALAQVKH
jgi:epoxyqueuosine reductase